MHDPEMAHFVYLLTCYVVSRTVQLRIPSRLEFQVFHFKMPLIKVGLLVKYFENIFSKKIRPFFNTENDFENQNFDIFEEVVDNF